MPYTTSDGTRIYWEEHGSGEPLLLIMGLGYTSDMWYRMIPHLAPRFRTIIFDNRGVGRSDVPPGPYPLPIMAADAAAVMDAAGVQSAHVFGKSMGGMIAQELALLYPERVRSLVLGCTACGGPLSVAASAQVQTALHERATMPAEQGVRLMVPYVYDPATPQERIEEDLVVRLRTFPTAAGYLGQLEGIAMWSSYDRLDQINVPTLVIHGESDQLVPPGNGVVIANSIRGAELIMLPNASHIFITDQTEASALHILNFLERVSV